MLLRSATRADHVRHEREGSIRVVMKDRWQMWPGLRRTSAVVAIAALAIGGAKITSDHTMPGSGFSTVATVAADPTGPTGGPGGGPGGMNGSQFQPPGLPPQQPDYQGGINQPPLDQNNGISIYNSGNPQAPQQVPGQQGAQQPQQSWDQPAHGTQIPDYSTAPGYTQGPGKPNPDYQAPQQQSPQQGQQPQQPRQQQPSQAPTQNQQPEQPQNKQDDTTQQLNDQQRQQKCQAAMLKMGNPAAAALVNVGGTIEGGGGRNPAWFEPWLDPTSPTPSPCDGSCPPETTQKQEPDATQKQEGNEQQEQNKKEENKKQDKCQPNDLVPPLSGTPSPEDAARLKEFRDKARSAMDKVLKARPGMERDHVIPLRRLWDIPGFKNLSLAAQIFIANNPDNLKHIPSKWNSSKQDRLWSEPWEPGSTVTPELTPEDRAKLCADEAKATETVKNEIENETKRKPKFPGASTGVPEPPKSDEINNHKNDISWLKNEDQKLIGQMNDLMKLMRYLETDDQGRNVGYPQSEDVNPYTLARDVLDILGERESQVMDLLKQASQAPPAPESSSPFPWWLPIPLFTRIPIVVPI
ncbi:Uncharacterised protein [Mycobacteroides abscessus subsp. bolletii]|nr:Uncharacterised protein [Mycobacteroides abscessus subsp. bolletii]SKU50872.1 Uncharacterised protein [Mycobacteroides abscessus subsp. bolletii]SKX77198.1 Uncharacterised protein [Mycobacteroides abscessus subsp. bolletii]SLF29614.1 Uncharacterised protein [Mycobacteroides abscessus subsp. bolletii]SLI31965.1 Uncharacterised protein [Mycobacteroides abscessus subsp. bolletii]